MNEIVNITESAEKYLAKLLKDKNEVNLAVRIFISDPGTPKAETCLAYCKPDEAGEDDIILNLKLITVHVEKRSIPFLVDAEVNYDDFQDYEYRPVALINLVCDHSKEIVVQVVEDTLESDAFKPIGYKSWDISCIYSGRKTYRSPYAD